MDVNEFIRLYQSLDGPIKATVDILSYIVVRGIIAKWIGDEIRQYIFAPVCRFLVNAGISALRPLDRAIARKIHKHNVRMRRTSASNTFRVSQG